MHDSGVEKRENPPRERFDFEKMKASATSDNASIRKRAFIEYFERFKEFPSYLFETADRVDPRLSTTIQQLQEDPTTPALMRAGLDTLVRRLPS